METLGPLIARLRQERGWTQSDLAHRSGVSLATISEIERGKPRKLQSRNAVAVYQSLASVMPLTESDAAAFMDATGLSREFAHSQTPPGRLPDATYMAEVVADRVTYAGSLPHQRAPVARETLFFAGYRPGANAPETAELTPQVIQAVADLVVTIGPAKAEQSIRAILLSHGGGQPARAPQMSRPPLPPPRPAQPYPMIAPKRVDDIKPPPGSIAKSTGEGSKMFIPANPPAKREKPEGTKAQAGGRHRGKKEKGA